MSTSTISAHTTPTAPANHALSAVVTSLMAFCVNRASRTSQMYDIYTERREMRNLTDEMLSDIGITRSQLNQECKRKVTDIPANR